MRPTCINCLFCELLEINVLGVDDTDYEGDETLSYCGFKKFHPHDTHSIIRLAFKDLGGSDAKLYITEYLRNAITKGVEIYRKIGKAF